ncbi:hypothetical protein [Streptomyces alboflavus]|uniref:hypothetical protein n=1 Tax=Streptomyces alboflavus TaxID=67267 RepID=UPI0004C06C08|nr:hypothetical protein [Streptomyces alboflavus]
MTTTSPRTQYGPPLHPGESFRVDPNGPQAHTDPVAVAVQHLVPFLGLRAVLPVPDSRTRQWVFRYESYLKEGKEQGEGELLVKDPDYFLIEVDPGLDGESRIVRDARPLSEWGSLAGIGQLLAFLPIPGMQNKDGASHYWAFHVKDGRLLYRNIEIKHTSGYPDSIKRDDRPVAGEWMSLGGIGLITSFMSVPEAEKTGGVHQFRVFSFDPDWKLMVRTIGIKEGGGHDDSLIAPDTQVTGTSLPALDGITQLAAIVPVVPKPTDPADLFRFNVLHFKPQWELNLRAIEVKKGGPAYTVERLDSLVGQVYAQVSAFMSDLHRKLKQWFQAVVSWAKGVWNEITQYFSASSR